MIDKDYLTKLLSNFQKQRDDRFIEYNQFVGAVSAIDYLLTEVDKKETKEKGE